MRFIDIERLQPDPAWEEQAREARQKIEAGDRDPDAFAERWRMLRDSLAALSAGKCYYCEARSDRAAYDVDHFRPKSLYRFLALTPRNFRLACQFCNRPRRNPATGRVEGKSSHFPLLRNAPRAENEADLAIEDPVLLDPSNAADPPLLGFRTDGTACPADPDDAVVAERVDISIGLYSLNEPRLIEARREAALRIGEAVAGIISTIRREPDPVARQPMLSNYAKQLQQHIRHDAEFAAFARAVLSTHRGKPLVVTSPHRVVRLEF